MLCETGNEWMGHYTGSDTTRDGTTYVMGYYMGWDSIWDGQYMVRGIIRDGTSYGMGHYMGRDTQWDGILHATGKDVD